MTEELTSTPSLGSVGQGRYQIKEKIGRGGSAMVYRAWDTQLHREVAIKRFSTEDATENNLNELSGGPAALLEEARRLSRLQHPNIVTVHDAGEDDDGPFLVMELLPGMTLDDSVKRGVWPLEDFLRLARQCLEGLAAAHAADILHRDLKPSNIMVVWPPEAHTYQIKLLDFGLARFSRAPAMQTMDQGEGILGSIHYMAPEQFTREPLDTRTDLYTLACVFHHALTGKNAFDGETPAVVMAAHLSSRMEEPLTQLRPDLPPWLVNWISAALARDPAQRPASARWWLQMLETAPHAPPVMVKAAAPAAMPRAMPVANKAKPPAMTAQAIEAARLAKAGTPPKATHAAWAGTGTATGAGAAPVPSRKPAATKPTPPPASEDEEPGSGRRWLLWAGAGIAALGAVWFVLSKPGELPTVRIVVRPPSSSSPSPSSSAVAGDVAGSAPAPAAKATLAPATVVAAAALPSKPKPRAVPEPEAPPTTFPMAMERVGLAPGTPVPQPAVPSMTSPGSDVGSGSGQDLAPTDLEKLKASLNTEVTVRGTVASFGESKSGKTRYLNFSRQRDEAISVAINSDQAGESLNPEALKSMQGKVITVRGKVEDFRGKLQLYVTKAEDVKVIP